MGKERNNKNYIDKELYGEIMTAMKRSEIPDAVFELAKKMDMNLPKLFYEKILNSKNSHDKLSFSANLLGIYGNYFAAFYFKQRYANVKTKCHFMEKKISFVQMVIYLLRMKMVF